MVSRSARVRKVNAHSSRLPSFLGEGVAILQRLAATGVLEQLQTRLRIQRQGGYVGFDGFVYLLLHFCCLSGSLRALWLRVEGFRAPLGALVGRCSLLSPSSLSRMLAAAELHEVLTFGRWLLLEASGVLDLMKAWPSHAIDAQGLFLRLFAFDPIRVATRCRALPWGEDLPDAQRRCAELVAPGHAGRKRGEAVFSIGVLEDRGSGALLDASIGPGNGDVRAMFERAAEGVVETMERLHEPLDRSVLVADGEWGGVPYLTVCDQAGVPFLTRSSHYELLDSDLLWQRMEAADWQPVEDSKTGPVRYAAELGTLVLHAAHKTVQADGSPYPPLPVRMVVSRYEADQDQGRGKLIGDQRFELYATVRLSPQTLSASDVVSAFYGRSGQECGFQQQQRLFQLQRVFSTHLAGQLLCWLVAFFVWNVRLAAGFALSPPLPQPPAPPLRPTPAPAPPLPMRETAAPPRQETAEPPREETVTEPVAPVPSVELAQAQLAEALAAVDWSARLVRHKDFAWDAAQQVLVAPIGLPMRLSCVECFETTAALRFKRYLGRRKQQQVSVAVSVAEALPLRAALQAVRSAQAQRPPAQPPRPAPLRPMALEQSPPSVEEVGRYAVRWPSWRQAAIRQAFVEQVGDVTVQVQFPAHRAARTRHHPLIEANPARRQHRRLTWTERLERYKAVRPVVVRLEVASEDLARWLSQTSVETRHTRFEM